MMHPNFLREYSDPAFLLDIDRWESASTKESDQPEPQVAPSSVGDLHQLDDRLMSCWGSLVKQEEQLRRDLENSIVGNLVFGQVSILEPLEGLQPEPTLTRGLAWLLRAELKGGKATCLRSMFLSRFLDLVFGDHGTRSSGRQLISDHSDWRVDAEYQVVATRDGGLQRIDIVLQGRACKCDWVIGVEVKLRARLGDNQLARYEDALKQEYPERGVQLVYLTPRGKPSGHPSAKSISYECVAEGLVKSLLCFPSDSAAPFATLLLGDLLRGENAGLRRGPVGQQRSEILFRIKSAHSMQRTIGGEEQ